MNKFKVTAAMAAVAATATILAPVASADAVSFKRELERAGVPWSTEIYEAGQAGCDAVQMLGSKRAAVNFIATEVEDIPREALRVFINISVQHLCPELDDGK